MKKISVLLSIIIVSISLSAQTPNQKRGISFGNPSIVEADLVTMEGYITWFYNWGISPGNLDGIAQNYGVEYIPMAWNGYFDDEGIRTYYSNHPEAKYILGFNEPNFISQANMTPSQAAAEWPRIEAIADEFDLEIVGPAVNWCGGCVSENGTTYNNPYDYLDDFFAACPDCRVDYIAIHNYMCYAEPLIDYIEEFKKYGKKIWVTEFACGDQATITQTMQENLMLGALEYMDNDTMIYKYAWFLGRTNNSDWNIDIFESEGGKLTELGELYLYYDARHDTINFIPVPARIEAESYSTMSGIQIQKTSDFDGVINVGWTDPGDFLQYNIDVPEIGDYYIYLRVSANAAANIEVNIDGDSITYLDIPATGGWQNWETFSTVVPLEAGESKLKLITSTGNFNINWIRIENRDNSAPSVTAGDDIYMDLPQKSGTLSAEAEDSDGDDLRYLWTKAAGPTCTISDPDSASTSFTCTTAGNYTFIITVSDGFELASDQVVVQVSEEVTVANIKKKEIRVYPNPVEDKMHVIVGEGMESGTLDIVNISGQLIHSSLWTAEGGEVEFDLSAVLPGFYLVKLKCKDRVELIRVQKV